MPHGVWFKWYWKPSIRPVGSWTTILPAEIYIQLKVLLQYKHVYEKFRMGKHLQNSFFSLLFYYPITPRTALSCSVLSDVEEANRGT